MQIGDARRRRVGTDVDDPVAQPGNRATAVIDTRRRNSMVPELELFAGSPARSRARFGRLTAEAVESNNKNENCALR